MIDTLVAFDQKIAQQNILSELNIEPRDYVLMTMHRPATVDFKEGLLKLIDIMEFITGRHHLVFPIHPRTLKNLDQFGLTARIRSNKKLILTEPLDYFAFQKLVADCLFVITDSGGIQEETTFRRIPCLTLRPNTERPSTVDTGTNELIPFDMAAVQSRIDQIHSGTFKKGRIPDFWDGNSSKRILEICKKLLDVKPESVLS